MIEIRFHLKRDEHGYLSNFFPLPRPILIDGEAWPTSEHYYQAQKFVTTDPAHAEAIRTTRNPFDAWRMGNDPAHARRADWESVKDDVMRVALRAKFEQHPELAKSLLGTGDARLVEHTPKDRYWGDAGDGSGLNRLGALLMELREELRRTTSPADFWRIPYV